MENQNSKLIAILAWLSPSGSGLVIYLAICAATLASSNAGFFKNVFYIPQNFELRTAILGSINTLVERFVGDTIGRSAVVAIFWAIVGLAVYIFIWMSMNFSDELGNDLAITKYAHPKRVDIHSPLRDFISRVIFQFLVLCVLIFYINLILGVLLPIIGNLFRQSIDTWPSLSSWLHGLVGVVYEVMVLHFFVILVRLLTLRKRVFG